MRRLRDISIRYKLVAISTLISVAALVVASGALIAWDQVRSRTELSNNLQTLTKIVAENSTTAVSYFDTDAAVGTLQAIRAQSGIEAACIFDRNGLFAKYAANEGGACPSSPGADGTFLSGTSLWVVAPIVLENQRIGTIYVRSGLQEIAARLRLQMLSSLVILIGAGSVALILSSWLQGLISTPIGDLAGTMQAVSDRKDYRLRAVKRADDELGGLASSFNLMLAQIEERDAELLAAKAELESRVEQRTEELRNQLQETQRTQEALVKVNAELVRSNKELDDFAYIASHDLKEPLRGIHSYSGFLLEDYGSKLDEEAHSRLETLMRLSQRMEMLIDTLLHFARVGRVKLAHEHLDLDEVLHEAIDSLRIRLTELGVDIRIPRPLPPEFCDRIRIGEVFQNLIANAMKYNDKPEKWIEIGYENSDGPRTYYVRDNGIGIPAKHRESIFRIFKRLHPREKFGGGAGAGLTIVRKIVERHLGRLWLESQEGEGTTFFFTLSPDR